MVSLGTGCLFFYVSLKSFFSTRNINEWETTQGTITKSSVRSAGAAFLPDIEYQYFAHGIEYKGTAVTIPPELIYDPKIVEELLAEHPVDSKVDVYYNPKVHRLAVLEKTSSGMYHILIHMMLMITAFALLLVGVVYSLSLFQM